jgi:ribitol 2-dehydrogenase
MHMAISLKGKTALITGASSGIGRATARALAREGMSLVLSGRDRSRLDAVAREIGGGAIAIPADLAAPIEADRLVNEALQRFDHLDVLFANAGIYVSGDVATGDPDAWDDVIMTNVASVFRIVRRVLPHMIERESGDVLVTSSIAGHIAIPWEPVYSATKHAVQAFVHGVRRQVAPFKVRVGSLAPGMVFNSLWGIEDPAEVEHKVAERTGLRSEDVAEAAVFMLTRQPNVTIRDLVMLPQAQDL